MGIQIKNAPQGKAEYADDGSDWPLISGQVQWSNNTTDEWHTHVEFATAGKPPGVPLWGVLGDQDVTFPVTIQARQVPGLEGTVTLIWGEYANHVQFPVVMDSPGPYTGDPTKVNVYTGHATINIGPIARADTTGLVPLHGWTGISLKSRTILSNGNQFDNETNIGVFSAVDTTVPETPLNEAGIPLQAKAVNVLFSPNPDIYGIHLTEIKDQSVPVTAPFSLPTFENVLGYNYGQNSNLPQDGFKYSVTLDENLHLVPQIPGVPLPTQPAGISNFDTLDPLFISQNPPLPGNAANEHVLILAWDGPIAPGGFIDTLGNQIPGNVDLRSILKLIVYIGPNPQPAPPPPVPLIAIPNVVGLTLADAEKVITANGFRVGNVGQNNAPSTFNPGIVWTQVPSTGSLPPQTFINLGVAIGGAPPVMVNVPNIVGMTSAQANVAITSAQLVVGNISTANSPTVPKDNIISQSPAPQTSVVVGSAVTYVVSLGPVTPPVNVILGNIERDQNGNVLVTDNHGNSLILLP